MNYSGRRKRQTSVASTGDRSGLLARDCISVDRTVKKIIQVVSSTLLIN